MLHKYQQQLCQLGTQPHTHAHRYKEREGDQLKSCTRLHLVCFGSLSFSFAVAFAFAFALFAYAAHSVHLARATLGVNICTKSIPAINTVYLQICKILLIFLALKSMPSNLNSELFKSVLLHLQILTTCPGLYFYCS